MEGHYREAPTDCTTSFGEFGGEIRYDIGGFPISCIISTHDRPDLLVKSIESVAKQSAHLPFELFVVDDLGRDETRVAVESAMSVKKVPITYMVRSGVCGVSLSRNHGASASESEIIAFLDDDDLWNAGFLEKCVSALVSSGADMAISWMVVSDPTGSFAPQATIGPGLRPVDVAARNPGFTGSNFAIRRSAFDALNGFDPELQVSNDKDFLVRFLLAGFSYVVVPEFLAIHRRHAGPQLTAANERRAAGKEAYLRKHKSVLNWQGHRFLKKQIHRIRMQTSQDRYQKALHAVGFASNLSADDLKAVVRRCRRWRVPAE